MKRVKRLQPVADMAAREAERQARILAELNEQAAHERQRLEELERYRNGYEAQLAPGNAAMRGGRLLETQAFMAQLSQAIQRQQATLRQAEERAASQAQAWREQRAKAKALSLLVERRRREVRHKAERQDQNSADEAAQRKRSGNV